MIVFKNIRYKNFLSSGNSFTEINLRKNKSTLVVGHNGAGKSTMLDALSFSLFGKPHRKISKSQLVNSINQKHALVEVEFTVGTSNFKIIRGIKPNVFEIWKDGKMINQSSHAMEYQKILEQNILKLNHKSFHQVVVLGSSSFIPFMQLNAGHRRDVIEDLLDINIFSKMNVLLKEKNGSLKDKLSSINHNIDLLKNKMDQQSKYIRDIAALTTENKKKYEKQIKTAEDKIKKLQEHNNKLSAELTETGDVDLTELQDRKNSSIAFRAEQRQELKAIAQRGLFLEKNDECPTCEQPIQNKDGLIFQTKNEAYRIESTLRMVESDYKLIEEEIKSLQETIAAVNEKTNIINSNNREISSLNQSNDDLRSYLEEEVSTDLNDAREELEKITNEKDNWRRIAHVISDIIYKRITGESGYFDSRIVYISESGPKSNRKKRLAIIDQDGANHKFLTDGSYLALTPRFSPAAQEVAYLSYNKRIPRIFLLDLNTGSQKVLGDFPGMTFSPRYSPDGKKLVMSLARNGNTDIFEMDLTSLQMKRLTFMMV